ncbi:MAG: cytochrome c oxidase assembly protein [Pseudorhodoplanes sp.]|nr:cytochrome c oxidase assembly protein [Pseudorhodoplanes sp.]PWB66173.1 MAG: cytochrome c oxidase assembly protein [Bradyrhizobiaceae bacterium]
MSQAPIPRAAQPTTRRDLVVAAACGAFVALMVGASFAAVPFYDWFCRTTGFGGRTQVATAAPGEVLARRLTVRFDANVAGGLPWRFVPERTSLEVRLGEVVTVNYTITNLAARETVGQASYNVAPSTAGIHFQKINCFCFTDQALAPGERREMAVVFYVDPALAKDREQDGLNTITLSYTMHPVRRPDRPVAEGNGALPPGRS